MEELELWKPVKDYEDCYLVSNFGRVFSLPKTDSAGRVLAGKICKAQKHSNGYFFVPLTKNGKTKQMRIHRLVADAFIPNPYNAPEVNHIDGKKENNFASNLEWCTRAENNKHAIKFGLRDLTYMHIQARKANMRAVCQLDNNHEVIAVYPSMTDAGKAIGLNAGCISRAVHSKGKSGGYYWRYA